MYPLSLPLFAVLAAAASSPGAATASTDTHLTSTPAAQTQPAVDIDKILECKEPVYDFGTVWSGTVIKHEFKVRNVSSQTVWVKAVEAFAGTRPDRVYQVDPGQEFAVPLSVSTKSFCGQIAKTISLELIPAPHEIP